MFYRIFGGYLCFQEYKACFEMVGGGTGDKTLEDAFFELEVRFDPVLKHCLPKLFLFSVL